MTRSARLTALAATLTVGALAVQAEGAWAQPNRPSRGSCAPGQGELVKVVLTFDEPDPSSRFFSTFQAVPEGQRLCVDHVSLFVQLRETTDPPPVKAIAWLETAQVELNDQQRFSQKEPLGAIDWLDKSPPPFVGTTQGILRTEMSTFTDSFVRVTFTMNEQIALAFDAAGTPLSHVVIDGRLVEQP